MGAGAQLIQPSGLPESSRSFCTAQAAPAIVNNKGTTTNPGLVPENMWILQGFPTTPASTTAKSTFPFGMWFAKPDILYVADEGNGTSTNATFSATSDGRSYAVAGYPAGLNNGKGGTGMPWAPATDGLRNLTGKVNPDGTVSIWATTSTVSGSGDQGADPNRAVEITDRPGATTLPAGERFHSVLVPQSGTVLRGQYGHGAGYGDQSEGPG